MEVTSSAKRWCLSANQYAIFVLILAHIHISISWSYVFLLLTLWSWVLLERPMVFQQVRIFPTFYGTRRFITAFPSARHLSLLWASSIQSMPSHPTSWMSILISYSYLRLGLPSGLFLSSFPTKTLYTPPPFPYVLHARPKSFLSIWSPEQYWVKISDATCSYVGYYENDTCINLQLKLARICVYVLG
jgi:hypothetical protein